MTGGERLARTRMKQIVFVVFASAFISAVFAAELDTAKIDQLPGLKGRFNEKEGVYRVTSPAMT